MSIHLVMSLTTARAEIVYSGKAAFLVLAYDELPAFIKEISGRQKFKDAFFDLWRFIVILAYNSGSRVTHVHTNSHFLFHTEEFRRILKILNLSHCPDLSPCPIWEYRPTRKSHQAILTPSNTLTPPILISLEPDPDNNALEPNPDSNTSTPHQAVVRPQQALIPFPPPPRLPLLPTPQAPFLLAPPGLFSQQFH